VKSPDILFREISVFKLMAKLWAGLFVALTALLWVASRARGSAEFHPWDAIAGAAGAIGSASLALLVIVIGGKLLVSLFQIARHDPDRIVLAAPWLFEGAEVRQARKHAESRQRGLCG
jgi:hypothetical protein